MILNIDIDFTPIEDHADGEYIIYILYLDGLL